MPSRSSWRTRVVRTFGAIPPTPLGELAELQRAGQQGVDHEQRPLVADARDGLLQRGVGLCHRRRISGVRSQSIVSCKSQVTS